MTLTERQLGYLRVFRGYTQDEATLAGDCADEVEQLRAQLERALSIVPDQDIVDWILHGDQSGSSA